MDLQNNDTSIPLWTEKVGRQSGRDHLGLESVGQTMLEEISYGISNITKRMRYFSFYAWVIKSFFDSDQEKNYTNYRLHLNKYSFLYMLSTSSAHLQNSLTGIDGIDFAKKYLPAILERTKVIDDAFFLNTEQNERYNNNNWIYKAKLMNLNISAQADNTLIPSLVEPYGSALADLFESKIRDLPLQTIDLSIIQEDTLKKLEERWCYHRLSENEEERALLEDILFARPFTDPLQTNRRYTLVLLLEFINQFHTQDLEVFERWIYSPSVLPPQLSRMKYFWKLLYARNYLVFSLESLFLYFLRTIENTPQTYEEFFATIEDTIQKNHIANKEYDILYNKFHSPIQEILDSLYGKSQIDENHAAYEPSLIIPLNQIKNRIPQEDLHRFLFNSILCLLSLYYRYRSNPEIYFTKDQIRFLNLGDTFRLSLKRFFDMIDSAIANKKTLSEFIFDLYQTQLLPRHQLVASEKLSSENLDTFHFLLEDNRYIFMNRDESFTPSYNAMKIGSMVNFFEDLNLIVSDEEKKYTLSENGMRVSKEYNE